MAQSQADFIKAFAGQWQDYEPTLASSPPSLCKLNFSATASGSRMSLSASGCAAPLASAVSWSIEGSQLALYDGAGAVVVRLGGNQRRVTGTTDDNTPIVLERAGGDGTATTLQAAYNASGCYYVGYSQKCAPRTELGKPAAAPDGRTQIHLEADLMVHSEPRADAASVGTAKQGSCVVVNTCIVASDGPWCRANFGQATGWLRKFSLRQNRWPVITFTNSCPQP